MDSVAVSRGQPLKRRSSRIALTACVRLSDEDREKSAFTLSATATNLNKHGAAIRLNRELLVGSTVVLKNARGKQAPGRIVAQVSAVQGVYMYGLEFLEHDGEKDFWGITFPG